MDGFASALEELRTGRKRGHWIWYVFPQIDGLGISGMSARFALQGEEEATEFLRDTELRSRLLAITRVVAEQLRIGQAKSLGVLMGSDIDAKKVVSSLTLFAHIAGKVHDVKDASAYREVAEAADEVLSLAARHGYPRCSYTLGRMRGLT